MSEELHDESVLAGNLSGAIGVSTGVSAIETTPTAANQPRVSRLRPVLGRMRRRAAWYAEASDAELLAAAAESDDEQAFAQLVLRYQDGLFTLALRMLRSRADASEAVQEALFSAWRARASFRGEAQVRSWLYRITQNAVFNRIRARRDEDLVDELPARAERAASSEVDSCQQRLEILDALGQLAPAFREVVVLADMLALPLAEIAQITNAPENTVKTRLFRGRNAIAAVLRGETAV
jgi:RNA polymerase sigma-70 factor (ECF subfamily)